MLIAKAEILTIDNIMVHFVTIFLIERTKLDENTKGAI